LKLATADTIQSLIPQRPPFVMIDELICSDEIRTRTSFIVREDNIFTTDGELTEPALVENIAQTAAARAGYDAMSNNAPVMVGYIGAIKDLEILFLPRVGDVLETEIEIVNQVFDVTLIRGSVRLSGQEVAKCEMKIFISKNT
jgi:predicted hotdog family 3-hydroxylacyl-ACP dehydratase